MELELASFRQQWHEELLEKKENSSPGNAKLGSQECTLSCGSPAPPEKKAEASGSSKGSPTVSKKSSEEKDGQHNNEELNVEKVRENYDLINSSLQRM